MPAGTEAAGLPVTFHSAVYAIIGVRPQGRTHGAALVQDARRERGRWAIVGVRSTSTSSKTRLALALTFSPMRSAQSMTRAAHPAAEAVGLPGPLLEPVVVLHGVALGAYAGEELRHERQRRIGVVRVDLVHVVAEVGEQLGGVAHGLHVGRVRAYADG